MQMHPGKYRLDGPEVAIRAILAEKGGSLELGQLRKLMDELRRKAGGDDYNSIYSISNALHRLRDKGDISVGVISIVQEKGKAVEKLLPDFKGEIKRGVQITLTERGKEEKRKVDMIIERGRILEDFRARR